VLIQQAAKLCVLGSQRSLCVVTHINEAIPDRGVMIAGVIAYSRSKAVVKVFWPILFANPAYLRNIAV
jgi:hypothetical protein